MFVFDDDGQLGIQDKGSPAQQEQTLSTRESRRDSSSIRQRIPGAVPIKRWTGFANSEMGNDFLSNASTELQRGSAARGIAKPHPRTKTSHSQFCDRAVVVEVECADVLAVEPKAADRLKKFN
jgi:hypothetical protein